MTQARIQRASEDGNTYRIPLPSQLTIRCGSCEHPHVLEFSLDDGELVIHQKYVAPGDKRPQDIDIIICDKCVEGEHKDCKARETCECPRCHPGRRTNDFYFGEATCMKCGHKQDSVVPVGVDINNLQCNKCGLYVSVLKLDHQATMLYDLDGLRREVVEGDVLGFCAVATHRKENVDQFISGDVRAKMYVMIAACDILHRDLLGMVQTTCMNNDEIQL